MEAHHYRKASNETSRVCLALVSLQEQKGVVLPFCQTYSVQTLIFRMHCLVRLSLIFFLSGITSFVNLFQNINGYSLAGNDQPQTNQPNTGNNL